MDNPDVLPEIAVLLAADLTGGAVLVVNVADVTLEVRLEVATVPAVPALEVLNLKYIFHDNTVWVQKIYCQQKT